MADTAEEGMGETSGEAPGGEAVGERRVTGMVRDEVTVRNGKTQGREKREREK